VATSNSSIRNWSLKSKNTNKDNHKYSPLNNSVLSNKNTIPFHSLGNVDISMDDKLSASSSLSTSFQAQSPLNSRPDMTIKGTASIKCYHILNDKRYIVTKDTDDIVCVWDVLQAKKLESLGKENYESVIKMRQRIINVPNWFTVDLKLGMLTITLDETEWHSAWVNFKDMDLNHVRQSQYIDLSDSKGNFKLLN
jgi:hypothetical protein